MKRKYNLKKTIVLLFYFLLLGLFLIYYKDLFTKQIQEMKEDKQSVTETVAPVSGSSVFIPNEKKVVKTPEPVEVADNSGLTDSVQKQNLSCEDVRQVVPNPKNKTCEITKEGTLFPVDRLVDVSTDDFYYHGVSFTPYNHGKNMLIHTWEVQNKRKHPVYSNISVEFFNKDKSKIGEYQYTKKTGKIKYDPDNEDDYMNDKKLDKQQTGSVSYILDKSVLKAKCNFKDVTYVKISNSEKPQPKPTEKVVEESGETVAPKPTEGTGAEGEYKECWKRWG